jgi:hypothetical protein
VSEVWVMVLSCGSEVCDEGLTFDAREELWLTVADVIVFSAARALAMEALHEAMIVVDDWMQWLMS